MEDKVKKLDNLIYSVPHYDYPKHSRIHRLSSFDQEGAIVYVKREDELGFGISGSKIRKYLTLLPWLTDQKFQEALLMGGSFSNHILGITQLLKEKRIRPVLFLLGHPPHSLKGNFLWTSLLVEESDIYYFPKEKGAEIEQIAEKYIQKRKEENVKAALIPLGGSHDSALAGMLTLAQDVLRNEQEHNLHFDHIFIDAGTAMTASFLLLAFSFLKKVAHFHILLLAGTKEEFHIALENWKKKLEALLDEPIPYLSFTLHIPQNASSFGSVNTTVLKGIKELARQEGIFTDPVYTGKLFLEGKLLVKQLSLKGNILFVHTGGGLGLCGFQEALSNLIASK